MRRGAGSSARPTAGVGGALGVFSALLVLGVLACLPGAAIAASLNFVEPASSPEATGAGPHGVAAADLDGDGDKDLAVAEQQSASLRILLNRGTGNFTEAATSPEPTVFSFPQSIAVANVDGDHDRDLAVAHQLTPDGKVTIFKNKGSGDFFQPASSPEAAGDQPLAIVAADFNLDTGPDLAVVNGLGGNVTVLGNNGSGNFLQP